MLDNITLFLIINIINGAGYSLINPLLPILGKKENLSESALGWMIGIFPISSCTITTMVPYLGKKFSRVKLLTVGTFFGSVATILYAFLIFISNKTLLIVCFFILRIFHGFCATVSAVLINSLTIASAKKGNTQSSLGKAEIALSLGVSTGPLICSIFYKIGGYTLPFFFTGIFSFFSFFLTFKVNTKKIRKNKEDKKDDNTNNNYLKYLINPGIYSILIGFVVCMIGGTFFSPCLTYHLINSYSLSVSISSLFFIIPVVPYILISQFLDWISAKIGMYLTFTLGFILSGISSLFYYPVPPIPQSTTFIVIGFILLGIGMSPVFIPGLVMLSENIKKIDSSIDEMNANDIASSINNLFIETGNFLGPIIGGYLADNFGFKLCCVIVSSVVIACSAIFTFFFFGKIKNDFCKSFFHKESENNENINEQELEENNNDDYFKKIKANILMNKNTDRLSTSSYNKERENDNNDRNSLHSSLI